MKRTVLLLLAPLLLAGCSKAPSVAAPTPSLTQAPVKITMTLYDNIADDLNSLGHAYSTDSTGCQGRESAGFGDISTGHTMDISDPSGTVIASQDLGNGVVTPPADGNPASCVFTVTYPNMPGGLGLTRITVGGRGALTAQPEDLYSGFEGLTLNVPSK